jgi:hypothetical protein
MSALGKADASTGHSSQERRKKKGACKSKRTKMRMRGRTEFHGQRMMKKRGREYNGRRKRKRKKNLRR